MRMKISKSYLAESENNFEYHLPLICYAFAAAMSDFECDVEVVEGSHILHPVFISERFVGKEIEFERPSRRCTSVDDGSLLNLRNDMTYYIEYVDRLAPRVTSFDFDDIYRCAEERSVFSYYMNMVDIETEADTAPVSFSRRWYKTSPLQPFLQEVIVRTDRHDGYLDIALEAIEGSHDMYNFRIKCDGFENDIRKKRKEKLL